MKALIISIAILVTSCGVESQTMLYDFNSKLEMSILTNEVTLLPGSDTFELTVSVKNNYGHSLIFYDFKGIQPGGLNPEEHQTPNSVGGTALVMFRDSVYLHLQDISEAEDSEFIRGLKSGKFLTRDSTQLFDSFLSSSGKKMRDRLIVVKKGETWVGKLLIKLDKRWLQKPMAYRQIFGAEVYGESELYLIYNCGQNITNLIPLEIIREDERNYDAVLYQGYVRSNVIKLNIKE